MAFNSSFFKSFVYAGRGLFGFFNLERNAKVHLLMAILAILLSFFLGLNALEWVAILGCIGMVISMEAMNSALEHVVDLVSPQHHPLAGKAKDLAAGAVLWASIFAAVIGLVIFVPKIMAFL